MTKELEFAPEEHVVYPTHGVGQVVSIEEQEISGMALTLYVVDFAHEKMTLRVPIAKAKNVGMRALSTPKQMKSAWILSKAGHGLNAQCGAAGHRNMKRKSIPAIPFKLPKSSAICIEMKISPINPIASGRFMKLLLCACRANWLWLRKLRPTLRLKKFRAF